MKKLYSIFALTVFFSLFNNSYAVINTPSTVLGMSIAATPAAKPNTLDLKKMSIAQMETALGHKLTWKQKLAMKIAKAKDSEGSFGIGFLLGFFLGLIGVIIAYVAFEGEKKTRKGAWWGLITTLLLTLILVIIIAAASTTV